MDTNASLWKIAENAAFRVEFIMGGKNLEERKMKDSEERDMIYY